MRPEAHRGQRRRVYHARGVGSGALAEWLHHRRNGRQARLRVRVRRYGGGHGAAAGVGVPAPVARGTADHASGRAVPRRRRALARAASDLHVVVQRVRWHGEAPATLRLVVSPAVHGGDKRCHHF